MYIDFGPLHANAQNVCFGLTLGLALLLIGLGAVQWARQLMYDREMVEHRHAAASTEEDRVADREDARRGRRRSPASPGARCIGRSLLGALGLRRPARRSCCSPTSVRGRPRRCGRRRSRRRSGTEGIRLVNDVTYGRSRPSEMQIGQLVNAQPENLAGATTAPSSRSRRPRRRSSSSGWTRTRSRSPSRAGLAGRRDPVLLQDLHPRRLPDQPVGAADPPPALPLPPVDVRPGRLRGGGVRSGRPLAAPAADHHRRRGLSGRPERFTVPVGPSYLRA